MPDARLTYLFERHLSKTCTESEKQELAVLLLSSKYAADVNELLQKTWDEGNADAFSAEKLSPEKAGAFVESITSSKQNTIGKKTIVRKLFSGYRMAAACILLVLMSAIVYFITANKSKVELAKNEVPVKKISTDIIAPATAKAIITLADGTKLPLDSIANGSVTKQGAVNLVKTSTGQLVYEGGQYAAGKVQLNKLDNPRGSKVVDMVLADGSRVWLNAGSSITYPVAFAGKERKVSITGEAYFEVVHNAAMPFKVGNDKVEVTDLGTEFNVNAFENETDIKVTLLQGSVSISRPALAGAETKGIVIKPGEQALVSSGIKVMKDVNIDKVMAWKKGVFNFTDATLEEVMHQLERWYNIDVVYEKDAPKLVFVGKMSMGLSLSSVLHILEGSKVHFRQEGRRLVVLP